MGTNRWANTAPSVSVSSPVQEETPVVDEIRSLLLKWNEKGNNVKRDAINKAMASIGRPNSVTLATSAEGQMKPLSYFLTDGELKEILVNRAWPLTLRDVFNMERFSQWSPEAIQNCRVKVGNRTISGEELWGILTERYGDLNIPRGTGQPVNTTVPPVVSPAFQSKMDTLVSPPVSEEEYPRPDRMPGESNIEYMQRCKKAKRIWEETREKIAKGELPNTSLSLAASIANAGGTLPQESQTPVQREVKREVKAISQERSPEENLAILLKGVLSQTTGESLSEERVREIVREEIYKTFAFMLSSLPTHRKPE